MANESKTGFLNVQEAAYFLRYDEKKLLELVEAKKIPHSILPFGKILFCPIRLREWVLSFEQVPEYKVRKSAVDEIEEISLAEQICRKFGCITKTRNRYINIYEDQRVYAQLHPRSSGDGIDLALRECDDDPNLPRGTILEPIDIRELNGYRKANKDWLEGNGRFTKQPAVAFHIPSLLQNEPENAGWKEIEVLLKYALNKLHKEK